MRMMMAGLFDSFSRGINYLRIAVTDRCNLRCVYCMPPEGVPRIPHDEILSYEEIRTVVQAAAELGITRIRITGGEPLVRADLSKLVQMLSELEGVDEVALTTNGTLLKQYALELKQAGLKRVNVSLDTLSPDRFQRITRIGELKDVLDGIEAARNAGLNPVKINTVVMRGINDDEVLDFVKMACTEDWHIRFIELMPFGDVVEFVPSCELQQRISLLGELEPCSTNIGAGPAISYRLAGAKGTIGFISPLTESSFCSRCNRVRLSPDGKLRPCLMVEDAIDLKWPLRNNAPIQELKSLIINAVDSKPEHHRLRDNNVVPINHKMSQIGG